MKKTKVLIYQFLLMVGLARSPPARQGKGEQRLRYEANPPLLTKFHTLPMCPIRMSSHLCNLLTDSNKKSPSQGLTLRSECRECSHSLPSRKEEDECQGDLGGG